MTPLQRSETLIAEWRANKLEDDVGRRVRHGRVHARARGHAALPGQLCGSVREMSVLLTAWIGATFLGEGKTALRVTASALVVVGIVLIAVGG